MQAKSVRFLALPGCRYGLSETHHRSPQSVPIIGYAASIRTQGQCYERRSSSFAASAGSSTTPDLAVRRHGGVAKPSSYVRAVGCVNLRIEPGKWLVWSGGWAAGNPRWAKSRSRPTAGQILHRGRARCAQCHWDAEDQAQVQMIFRILWQPKLRCSLGHCGGHRATNSLAMLARMSGATSALRTRPRV